MEKFTIKKYIASSDKNVQDYLDSINSYLEKFQADNVIQLILAIDDVSKLITEDIKYLISDEPEKLRILTDDSKNFDKIQKLVEKIDHWKKVAEISESLKPIVEEVENIKQDLPKLEGGNPFEQAQEIARQKRNKK